MEGFTIVVVESHEEGIRNQRRHASFPTPPPPPPPPRKGSATTSSRSIEGTPEQRSLLSTFRNIPQSQRFTLHLKIDATETSADNQASSNLHRSLRPRKWKEARDTPISPKSLTFSHSHTLTFSQASCNRSRRRKAFAYTSQVIHEAHPRRFSFH